MKTAEQHFIDSLPADIASMAIENTRSADENRLIQEFDSAHKALGFSFHWRVTKQGHVFWQQVHDCLESGDFRDIETPKSELQMLRDIRAEVEELRKDKARLDWILSDDEPYLIDGSSGYNHYFYDRDEIDEAMGD